MSSSQADLHSEPVPPPYAERSPVSFARVRRIGRVRVPITLTHAPWATLYRFPDGRLLWTVRLWERDRPVQRVVPNSVLAEYARRCRLARLSAEIDRLVRQAREIDAVRR